MTLSSEPKPSEMFPRPGAGALVDDFAERGYAVVRGLFDPDEVVEVRRVIDELFEGYDRLPPRHCYDLDRRPSDGGLGNIPAIRDILRLRPRLRGSSGLAATLALAEQLLGGEAEVLWDAAIYKPAGSPSETPWHQDEAVYGLSRLRKPRSIVYFWLALDAVDEANGCIRFVPGSQRGALLAHVWRHGDTTSSLVADAAVESSAPVSVPLGPGDATVHHVRTLHGAGPNLSDRPRKAWVLGIGQPSSPRWARSLKRRLLRLGGRFHGLGRG